MGRLLERYQNAIECQDQVRPLHQRLGAFLPEIWRKETHHMFVEATLIASQIADKYLVTDETLTSLRDAFARKLAPPPSGHCWVPEMPLWIETETDHGPGISCGNGEARGIFLTDTYHPEVLKRAQSPLLRDPQFYAFTRSLGDIFHHCQIIGTQGLPIFGFAVNKHGYALPHADHRCPWQHCHYPQVCRQCQFHMSDWSQWANLALAKIQHTPPFLSEGGADLTVVETIKRRIENPQNPKKKKKYQLESFTYHIL